MARRAVTYLARDLTSLDALKLSCERDEGQLNAILIALLVAKVDNPTGDDLPATVAIYERQPVPPPPAAKIGQLIMIAGGAPPPNSRHLLDGEGQIGATAGPIRVFKPQ